MPKKIVQTTILQRYIIREWFRTFLPSFLCFEILIFIGFVIQLLHKGLDVIALKALIPHIFIQAFPYSIPPALLTATAMTYGRMSADHEITAIEASGVQLRTIIIPVLLIGVAFSVMTMALSAEVLPRSAHRIVVLQERAIRNILAERLVTFRNKIDLHPYQIYIGNTEDNINKDIAVIRYVDDYVTDIILAREGKLEVDEFKNKILLILQDGEFIKPNYNKHGDIPRAGRFEKTTFEIPMSEEDSGRKTKYMTIFQLLKLNQELSDELIDRKKAIQNEEKNKDQIVKELVAYREKLAELSKKEKKYQLELKRAKDNMDRQESKIEGLKNEARIARNYILVANENLIQMKKESAAHSSLDKNISKKIMKVREAIEKEQQRIYRIEQELTEARKLQAEEKKNIASITKIISEINTRREVLLKRYGDFAGDFDIAQKEESIRKNSISVHKRLSQAFSCMAFIVVGIPLGIRLRSGNLIVCFGASFLVILFIYYPLVVTGAVMAEDTFLPTVPFIWGADIIFFLAGIFIFKKLFTL